LIYIKESNTIYHHENAIRAVKHDANRNSSTTNKRRVNTNDHCCLAKSIFCKNVANQFPIQEQQSPSDKLNAKYDGHTDCIKHAHNATIDKTISAFVVK
jgi:hypothetical protein